MPVEPTLEEKVAALTDRVEVLEGEIHDLHSTVVITPSNSQRSLNQAFILGNETQPVLVVYTVELTVQSLLLQSQEASVTLLHGLGQPTTVSDKASASNQQLLGLLPVGLKSVIRQHVIGVIPPGHTVLLQTAGAGTVTLTQCSEWTISATTAP